MSTRLLNLTPLRCVLSSLWFWAKLGSSPLSQESIVEISCPVSCFQILRMSSSLPASMFKNLSSRSIIPSSSRLGIFFLMLRARNFCKASFYSICYVSIFSRATISLVRPSFFTFSRFLHVNLPVCVLRLLKESRLSAIVLFELFLESMV